MDKRIDRRTFIGTGVAASALPAASAAPGKHPLPYNPRTHQAMPTHNLGKTGFRVGILSLGGQATLEIPGKEAESVAIINRAIDLGVNYIDSAAVYGKGASEKHIGLVLKSRRKEVFVTSKTADRTYDGSMRLIDQTLTNMQTDHLDLWQIHNLQTRQELE
ncbi:MAG: aldo/keto reductase, partial [Candidatus Solibacter usitatus]|nr:aldo/keto reductase [Candidatus Solibacter usitatus]